MNRDRYPMIEELRRRFAAHKLRWGRYPRSWTLSPKRWKRLKREHANAPTDAMFDTFGVIRIGRVPVSCRPTQMTFRTSIPAERWRRQS